MFQQRIENGFEPCMKKNEESDEVDQSTTRARTSAVAIKKEILSFARSNYSDLFLSRNFNPSLKSIPN